MKIKDIITEHVNDADSFVSGNMIDPELMEIEKRLRQEEEGLDPDHAEIVQDLPV
jgi:hypothetical protein